MSISRVKEVLTDLVGFPTVSSGSNLDCIAYIREFLLDCGAQVWTQNDETGKKANLLATIGPMISGGVILSGHTDVVPVDGQNWTTDPWTTVEKDGRIYGRGTTDMKGFLAAMLITVASASKRQLARPIHLAFSYDEELGCLGAWPLSEMIKDHLPDRPPIIVGEPTRNKVVTSHKGIGTFITKVDGHAVHSSRVHEGVSAVTESARLIAWLDDHMYEQAATNVSAVFDPPFTTIHCGMVSGGNAVNVVAANCTFTTDVRTIEGRDPRDYQATFERYIKEKVLPRIQAIQPDTHITVTQKSFTPGFDPESDSAAETVARQITGDNETRTVAYSTEAGVFQKCGLVPVVCGPGDISQAHQANEYIEVAELERSLEVLGRLIDLQCA